MVEEAKKFVADIKFLTGLISSLVICTFSVGVWAANVSSKVESNREKIASLAEAYEKQSEAREANTKALIRTATKLENAVDAINDLKTVINSKLITFQDTKSYTE